MNRSAPTPSERRVVWQAHLAGWRASGQSQAAYCREHELSAVQFRWWKRRLEASAESPPAAASAFLPVQLAPEAPAPVVAPARSDSGVRLHWGEVHIELALGFDRASLRAELWELNTTAVYVARASVDMRRSIDGLAPAAYGRRLVSQVLAEDPFSAKLFVFTNRRRDRLKALRYDDTDCCIEKLSGSVHKWLIL